MILKLIQSGGFAGKTKFAEEELSSASTGLQEYLHKRFSEFPEEPAAGGPSAQRDAFQYFLEYNGTRLPLAEDTEMEPEFAAFLAQLKAKLHY